MTTKPRIEPNSIRGMLCGLIALDTERNGIGLATLWHTVAVAAIVCTAGCATTSNTTLVLDYDDFGPQSASYETIGMEWWQWDRHGEPNPSQQYDVKVAVYRGISLQQVQAAYPFAKEKKQDYRYLSYDEAMMYLNDQIQENLLPDVTRRLRDTKSRIQDELGKPGH